MLVYHPFADINHGVFRSLLLHKHVFGQTIDFDYWRILDFLYLFPHEARHIRVPQNLVSQKNALAKQYNKYNDVPSPREFIAQTASIHATITAILGAKGILNSQALKGGKIEWQADEWAADLRDRCAERADQHEAVLGFLRSLTELVPATGPDGIKARTNWMEHRYDP